jgi:hypothetical protein
MTVGLKPRDQLARFKTDRPRGNASGPPLSRAHVSERFLPGIGGNSNDDVLRSFATSAAELERPWPKPRVRPTGSPTACSNATRAAGP